MVLECKRTGLHAIGLNLTNVRTWKGWFTASSVASKAWWSHLRKDSTICLQPIEDILGVLMDFQVQKIELYVLQNWTINCSKSFIGYALSLVISTFHFLFRWSCHLSISNNYVHLLYLYPLLRLLQINGTESCWEKWSFTVGSLLCINRFLVRAW